MLKININKNINMLNIYLQLYIKRYIIFLVKGGNTMKTKYIMVISKEQQDKASSYCKEHDTLLSRELRNYIGILAKRYDREHKEDK